MSAAVGAAPRVAVPGDRLGASAEVSGGQVRALQLRVPDLRTHASLTRTAPTQGTYTLHGAVFAGAVGVVRSSTDESGKETLYVEQHKPVSVLPGRGDRVTVRVNKVNARFATVEILVVGDRLLKESFPGTIRTRDVRSFDIDSVQIYRSFRPGDLVRAEVVSLGDAKSYYLSTAKNELGVVLARSASANAVMIPASWNSMVCPVTGAKEARKVAKVEDASAPPDKAPSGKIKA